MEAKKILYVITKANFGGAQKYVLDLAGAGKQGNYQVAVVYGEPGLLVEKLHAQGIRTIATQTLGRDVHTGSDLQSFFDLIKIFRREHPGIVHLNSSKAGALGAVAARIAHVPRIIFTAHGWAYNEARPFWQKVPIVFAHYVCVLLSHKTICVSEAVRRDALWMPFIAHKLQTIRHGIQTPAFITSAEARTFLAKHHSIREPFWIGMNSELHPNKRIDLAIEAFGALATEFPDTALVVISNGAEREKLETLAYEKNVSDRVHLVGFVPEAARYLKAFDIFLFPSHTEALGYALIEAGYAALPCIASKVGGIPEIIDDGENGILFQRGNVNALTAALKRLLVSPNERLRLGAALHEKVTREFSLERMVADTFRLYQS